MLRFWVLSLGLVVALGCAGAAKDRADGDADKGWTEPTLPDRATLSSVGRNPYFVLEPGYVLHLKKKDGVDTLTVSVLNETKVVDGVETRVVEERETGGGKLVEVSRNFFAVSKQNGDLYYFGEEVDIYKDGKVTGHEGAWLAGVNGAKPGLMIPGEPKVGVRFYQELAPKVAMDRSEIVSVTATYATPAGDFKKVLKVKEGSAIEKGEDEIKQYAPGVGLIQDEEFVLVKYGRE
jgi:hypothetical protein